MGEQAFVIRVWGRVQGVGFRYFTREQALSLGLKGHAFNLEDGSVEVLISGPAREVQQMLGWLAHGPATATVTRMECEEVPLSRQAGFQTN